MDSMDTSRRVLVVDDQPDILRFVRAALEDEGFAVDTALDGESAVRIAGQRAPGVVLLDWGLPGMGGEEVAASLRQRHAELPIAIITADGRAAEKADRSSAYGYLHKPFSLEQLLELVERGMPQGVV